MVRTTSASSGPSGSAARSPVRGAPARSVTAGSGRSTGAGTALARPSNSSARPRPVAAQTGMTGWNEPRATAVSRSAMSVAWSMSSPLR